MNRKDFLKSLLLGGIILPTLPRKLILTGGWFPGHGIEDDFAVNALTGNIRYVGKGQQYTVLDLHRWLQGEADRFDGFAPDALDITACNPSLRMTDHIIELQGKYNIDDATAEHIFDGSLIQKGGQELFDSVVSPKDLLAEHQARINGLLS